MAFQRENQRISANEILQAIASGEEIRFKGCTISGDLDINRLFVKDEDFDNSNLKVTTVGDNRTLVLVEEIEFNSCTFENHVCFASPWEEPGRLQVVFKKDVLFNSSVFCDQIRFSGAQFDGLASFDGCTFQRIAAFRMVTYNANAMYRTVAFDGYGLFDGAVFHGRTGFTNTHFSKGG